MRKRRKNENRLNRLFDNAIVTVETPGGDAQLQAERFEWYEGRTARLCSFFLKKTDNKAAVKSAFLTRIAHSYNGFLSEEELITTVTRGI